MISKGRSFSLIPIMICKNCQEIILLVLNPSSQPPPLPSSKKKKSWEKKAKWSKYQVSNISNKPKDQRYTWFSWWISAAEAYLEPSWTSKIECFFSRTILDCFFVWRQCHLTNQVIHFTLLFQTCDLPGKALFFKISIVLSIREVIIQRNKNSAIFPPYSVINLCGNGLISEITNRAIRGDLPMFRDEYHRKISCFLTTYYL